MEVNEEQAEELEVLCSIFEEDEAFKQISNTCIQYKIGDDSSLQSFLIEFVWPSNYPHCCPEINLDAFYNNRILTSVKQGIITALTEQAETMLGEAMIYSLIDWAKEHHEQLIADQPLKNTKSSEKSDEVDNSKTKTVKKEQLTKAQKRKLADRVGAGGERPRGWNWVDPIKHLSQTGKVNE